MTDTDLAAAPEPRRPRATTPGATPAAARPASAGAGALVRSSAVVGLGTMLSRVTGLVRTLALAFVLGHAVLATGYNLANTTPNMVYDLLLGGILSATLVPVFVGQIERDDHEGIDAVVTVLVTAMVAFTVVAMLAAPWIFRIYTWASSTNRDQLIDVGVPLLRWFLPQILFYGLTALGTALLNARRSYAAAAFAPVLNNIVVLAMLGAFWVLRSRHEVPSATTVAHSPALLALLGGGTTIGIVAMALVLWPAMRRAGIRLHWRFDHRNRSVRKVFGLSAWTLAYAAVNQVALVVVLALASHHSTDDVNAYTYAFIFFQLPYGLFAVSLMTTVVPELSSFVARADAAGFRRSFALGFRMLLLVMVPASIGCAVLAHPLVTALLGHARYRSAAPLTGDILLLFATGMVGYSVYLYALRVFYALRDTRTPFLLSVFQNAVNVVLALLFIYVFKLNAQGLALAYSVAYSAAAVIALAAARKRMVRLDGRRTVAASVRIGLASAAMGVAVAAVVRLIGPADGFKALIPTFAGTAVGGAVYAGLVVLLQIEEVDLLLRRVRRTRRSPASP